MAFEYEVIGWQDFSDEPRRIDGMPDDLSQVASVLVVSWDEETGQEEYWWVHSYAPFDDWDQWNNLIEDHMDMYGLDIAS